MACCMSCDVVLGHLEAVGEIALKQTGVFWFCRTTAVLLITV